MRRCRRFDQLLWQRPWLQQRVYSEYAPAAPSPSDLKAPLPEKFSVGKNLKLKAVLFEYDFLAGSASNRTREAARTSANSSSGGGGATSSMTNGKARDTATANGTKTVFQPLSPSGEKMVDEITGLLGKARTSVGPGGENLQDMGRTLIAGLKEKMGLGAGSGRATPPPKATPSSAASKPTDAKESDPKAKYMQKLRQKTRGRSSTISTASSQAPGDAGLLFAARESVALAEGISVSAWMLRPGAGDLLLYLAARCVRLGVIASPQTTPQEFESFVKQLREQAIEVQAAIPPAMLELEGVEASVARACSDFGASGVGHEVMVVGSNDPILLAANAAKMFTTRYHPPNSRREGVIQTYVIRNIDEVRTVVEEVNGVSFRYG